MYSFFKRMQSESGGMTEPWHCVVHRLTPLVKNELDNLAQSATSRSKSQKQRGQRPSSRASQTRGQSEDSVHRSQPTLVSATPRDEVPQARQGSGSSSGNMRPSSEQFYKSVIGVAKAVPNVAAHKRASSVFTPAARTTEEPSEISSGSKWAFTTNAASAREEDDFDAILRSNETVRVSLTPSRFSSIEVRKVVLVILLTPDITAQVHEAPQRPPCCACVF